MGSKKPELIREHYSFSDFLARVQERLTAGACWNDSSLTGSHTFTKTKSMEHALHLCRKGWFEGAQKIISGLDSLEGATATISRAPAVHYDVAGEVPDVAAYCAGECEHMMTFEPDEENHAPVVRIMFDGCYDGKTKTGQIENQGIALLSCIDALERTGRNVELIWSGASKNRDRTMAYCCDVTIKQAGEHFDVDRAAFALAHPSMLRRMWFACAELNPACEPLGYGYGVVKRLDAEHLEPGVWYLPSIDALGGCYNLAETVKAVTDWLNDRLTAEDTHTAHTDGEAA
jgi:hypothetical protein